MPNPIVSRPRQLHNYFSLSPSLPLPLLITHTPNLNTLHLPLSLSPSLPPSYVTHTHPSTHIYTNRTYCLLSIFHSIHLLLLPTNGSHICTRDMAEPGIPVGGPLEPGQEMDRVGVDTHDRTIHHREKRPGW
jgi:hypothetical protein